jgi:hypothetical protein
LLIKAKILNKKIVKKKNKQKINYQKKTENCQNRLNKFLNIKILKLKIKTNNQNNLEKEFLLNKQFMKEFPLLEEE